jgi:hypothetical protein
MCQRTCRDLHPDEPQTWCSSCTEQEALERQANYERWHAQAPDSQPCAWCQGKGAINILPQSLPCYVDWFKEGPIPIACPQCGGIGITPVGRPGDVEPHGMNLTRVLNTLADCHAALRLAGFTLDETQRILNGAMQDAIASRTQHTEQTEHTGEYEYEYSDEPIHRESLEF